MPPAMTQTVNAATTATAINQAVAAASNLPQLVAGLAAVDPALAEQLTGKAMIGSRSIYAPVATAGVTWLVGRFGLAWDPNTCALVSGLAVFAASVLFRKITNSPITGWFHAAKALPVIGSSSTAPAAIPAAGTSQQEPT